MSARSLYYYGPTLATHRGCKPGLDREAENTEPPFKTLSMGGPTTFLCLYI